MSLVSVVSSSVFQLFCIVELRQYSKVSNNRPGTITYHRETFLLRNHHLESVQKKKENTFSITVPRLFDGEKTCRPPLKREFCCRSNGVRHKFVRCLVPEKIG